MQLWMWSVNTHRVTCRIINGCVNLYSGKYFLFILHLKVFGCEDLLCFYLVEFVSLTFQRLSIKYLLKGIKDPGLCGILAFSPEQSDITAFLSVISVLVSSGALTLTYVFLCRNLHKPLFQLTKGRECECVNVWVGETFLKGYGSFCLASRITT